MARKADYGRGHPEFLKYAKFIAEHPAYRGMPDAYLEGGDIQWEAPSNRLSGKFKETNRKRREWWRRKALSIGISPTSGGDWISRTAKKIHPTKKKPCKKCGRVMEIGYAYPNERLLWRVSKLPYVNKSFKLDPLERIDGLLRRLVECYGDRVFADLPALLKSAGMVFPKLARKLEAWLRWIETSYIPGEPSMLSPGVMSNAPDRFDGFHSFDRCCRRTADRGRSKENLRSYVTDRRVFEYWVDGDWVAADRMMGVIRSDKRIRAEPCQYGHPGPCSADHIGPISLGFTHRPEFRLLCKACNSAKNNRMTLDDVGLLRKAEGAGEEVASWYAADLWGAQRGAVDKEEKALRLSKMLRDNRFTAMRLIDRVAKSGHLTFLVAFLGLEFADRQPTFQGVRVDRGVVKYASMVMERRATVYAGEQKARRVRVAFAALRKYVSKEGRNALEIETEDSRRLVDEALALLADSPTGVRRLDKELANILAAKTPSEERLRDLVQRVPTGRDVPHAFVAARRKLRVAMASVAREFSLRWSDERYVRGGDDE